LASICSAAKTAPPHLGHPWPSAALMQVVSVVTNGRAAERSSSLEILKRILRLEFFGG